MANFEQTFKNIDDLLYKDSGADSEIDYIEQTSWVLFLKYLDTFDQNRADVAILEGKEHQAILKPAFQWSTWAAPKDANGKIDIHTAMTGPDLVKFVEQELFPYLASFKEAHSDNPKTIEYKVGEIFSELSNKIKSGYNLREIIDMIDELPLGTSKDKHELSHLYETMAQAKDYAARLQIRFAICTNGHRYYMVDIETGTQQDIPAVPTPDELWALYQQGSTALVTEASVWEQRFYDIPFETKGGLWEPRYYQQNAINAVMKAVAQDQKRMLLTLATGTGKTAIAFQIAWKLFHAKWNMHRDGKRSPRILFLADRNILADQAFNAFTAFEEDALVRIAPKEINKRGKVPKNGSIFFTIFQTFSAGDYKETEDEPRIVAEASAQAAEPIQHYPVSTANFGQYPPDFFDFIIIDECHRGGASDESSWRGILEYFAPATQLGLTATPKRDVNGDTYKYFGEPIYIYSLKDGINDGFLTPFRVQQLQTNIDNYIYTEDDTVVQGEIEAGREYKEGDFNSKIRIQDREAFRVKTFLNLINQKEKGLVFCKTQEHAAFIRDLINQYADSNDPHYCERVTAHDGSLGELYLKEFQDNEKTLPTMLTTSQKLSTGVDAPEIRNIVLLREVNSMIEFKQIVGRGTRLFDGKAYFTIYDFVGAYKHFSDREWDGEPVEPEPTSPRPIPQPCTICKQRPCICERVAPEPCEVCGYVQCRCRGPKQMIEIVLGDGKKRQLQYMNTVTFWSPDGKPMTAEAFLKQLFGDLPTYFSSPEDLKAQWSAPHSRKKLLEQLAQKGFSLEALRQCQIVLDAEDSDIYDVLSYIAYATEMQPRAVRAQKAQEVMKGQIEVSHQEFLNFVLEQYVDNGFESLDDAKLGAYLTLKYKSVQDAKPILGDLNQVRNNFINYQQYLYGN